MMPLNIRNVEHMQRKTSEICYMLIDNQNVWTYCSR